MRAASSALGAWNSVAKTPRVALQRQLEIVPDRVAFEDRRLLEFSADAEPGDLRLVVLGEVDAALETDIAGSGCVLPVMISIIVVLPAPFGPMMARISPGSTMSDRPLIALKPSKER